MLLICAGVCIDGPAADSGSVNRVDTIVLAAAAEAGEYFVLTAE